ncbi:MAG: M48 family metalloprotease [Phycisphaerae bacterium]|nr:M48 family metalloprotease [Phycisphaerae bacterium]
MSIFMAMLIGDAIGELPERFIAFSGGQSLAIVAGSSIVIWSLFRLSSLTLLKKLQAMEDPANAMLVLPRKLDFFSNIIIVTAYGIQLISFGWAKLIILDWQLDRFILIDELALLLPFVLMLCAKWYCFYPLSRFVKEHVMTGRLSSGISTRPVWTVGQYMSFQIRNNLMIMLMPLLMVITIKDIVELAMPKDAEGNDTNASQVLVLLGIGLVFIISPLVLKHIWRTRSLPDGPLRSILSDFCAKQKLRYHDILLWDTYSGMSNAAVMGLIPQVRFVLLSDALIENMPDEQIKAVCGHEAGHVKHHHILFLVLFVMASGGLAAMGIDYLDRALKYVFDQRDWTPVIVDYIIFAASIAAIVGWFVLFGWVSRRFERQADVYAAGSLFIPYERPDCLSMHGAATMSNALHRIAILNGISVHAKSWRHSSLGSRMEFLHQLATEPGAMQRYNKFCRAIKIIIAAVFAIFILLGGLIA